MRFQQKIKYSSFKIKLVILFSSLFARKGGVAKLKTTLYLRAILENNVIKFGSLSCLTLLDLVVHTDRQMYK